MDKANAMARLDAIEKEAQELRRIINGKLEYASNKIYIGIFSGAPYYMLGDRKAGFCFYRLIDSVRSWSNPRSTGQECLDSHINDGFKIYDFTDTKNALQFFIDHL